MARWISGLTLTALVLVLVARAPAGTCRVVVTALTVVGAREYFLMSRLPRFLRGAGIVMAAVSSAVMTFLPGAGLFAFLPFAWVAGSLVLAMAQPGDDAGERVQRAGLVLLGTAYVAVGFGGIGRLFAGDGYRAWVFLALAATFLGDTGAYLAGRRFGTKKIVPSLSPSKTLEGFIGGLAGGAVAAIIVRLIFGGPVSFLAAAPLGILLALCGAAGDLAESAMKRGFGVKDSGTLIPGHGGLLDRVDGFLFSAPVLCFVRDVIL